MSVVSQILRQTREAKGITLEEVAQKTYIKPQYLVALEEGDVEKLPAPVYIHGYIRQYAKLLGLNGSELVLQYQQGASRPHAPAKLMVTPGPLLSELPAEPQEYVRRSAERSPFPPDLREPIQPRATESAPAEPLPEPSEREVLLPAAVSTNDSSRVPEPHSSANEVQQAKHQAKEIIVAAQREAHELRIASERYADQVLAQLENEVNRSLQTVRNGRAFLQSRRRKLQEI